MRILMLGWEFPPFMAGGLGTACFGLTRAMSRAGHDVTFVMPKAVGRGSADYVDLLGPDSLRPMLGEITSGQARAPSSMQTRLTPEVLRTAKEIVERELVEQPGLERASILRVPAGFESPYTEGLAVEATREAARLKELIRVLRERGIETPLGGVGAAAMLPSGAADELHALLDSAERLCADNSQYGKDLFGDAERYARVVAAMSTALDFDLIHAHDWLAFPAGMAVRAVTGKPLVCQVHATEFDRSGDSINQHVYDVERAGVHAADRVIAVSRLTAIT
ncbi:MAG: glycogen/starch synthase, partial [Phycisphaerales bacterium]|nr:glycogen/starch synthase [Phycisphaerales bacterium]